MKTMREYKHLYPRIFIPTLLLAVTICTGSLEAQVSTSLREHWDTLRVLDNPHKGWYHHFYANSLNNYGGPGQDVSVIPNLEYLYLRLAWSFFEPRENQYDWSIIDEVVEEYVPQGYRIALCITTKETGIESWGVVGEEVDGVNYATPKWVRDAGAKGMEVVNWDQRHWEPDFSDSIFLDKLADFHSAMAERYDGQPYLEYVDLCSIGDWGEGHTGFSSDIRPSDTMVMAHARIYDSCYKVTPLCVNDDYIYWRKSDAEAEALKTHFEEMGYWFADWSMMVEWWMKEGSPDTWGIHHPELFGENYPERPVIIECHHYKDLIGQGIWCSPEGNGCAPYGAPWLLKDIELMHASYISFQGWPETYMADNPAFARHVANRVGYWYFVDSFHVKGSLMPGDTLRVQVNWLNRGVAPAYHPYGMDLSLKGEEVVRLELEDAGNMEWMPGENHSEIYSLLVPEDFPVGPCDLKLRMWDKGDTGREVDLGFSESIRDEEGFFWIGTVNVGNVGVDEAGGENLPELYPNPAGEVLHCRTGGGVYGVSIWRPDGTMVLKREVRDAPTLLDISGLGKGLYFLRFEGGTDTQLHRFIKI